MKKKKKTEGSPEARGTYGRETGKESDEKEGEGEGKLAESTRLSVENDVHRRPIHASSVVGK